MQLLMALHRQLLLLKNSRLTPTCRAFHTVTFYAFMTTHRKFTVPNAQMQASYMVLCKRHKQYVRQMSGAAAPTPGNASRACSLTVNQPRQMAAILLSFETVTNSESRMQDQSSNKCQHHGSCTGSMPHINDQAITFHPRGDVIELYAHS